MKLRSTASAFLKQAALPLVLIVVAQVATAPMASMAKAQDFQDDDSFSSEDIDVNGTFRRKPSVADKMAKERRDLEEKNENLVRKKIEDVRIAEERKMTDRLRGMFNGQGFNTQDSVSTEQAGLAKSEAVMPKDPYTQKPFRVRPFFGTTSVQNNSEVDFESKLLTGLSFDAMVNPRFNVGVTLSYTNMDITMTRGLYSNYYSYYNSYYNPYYSSALNGSTREMKFSRYGIDINGKFNLIAESRIRPYVGAGVGYNKTKLDYKDENSNSSLYNTYYNGYSYGNQGYSSNSFVGIGLIGVDIDFSSSIGMNIEGRYTKGITSSYSKTNENTYYQTADQQFLEKLGQDIDDSSVMSFTAGFCIGF